MSEQFRLWLSVQTVGTRSKFDLPPSRHFSSGRKCVVSTRVNIFYMVFDIRNNKTETGRQL